MKERDAAWHLGRNLLVDCVCLLGYQLQQDCSSYLAEAEYQKSDGCGWPDIGYFSHSTLCDKQLKILLAS